MSRKEAKRLRASRQYNEKAAQGLCRNEGCHNPVTPGKVRCAPCLEHYNKLRQERRVRNREISLCIDCGNPSSGYSRCEVCRSGARRIDNKLYRISCEAGTCVTCGRPAAPNLRSCLVHWFSGIAKSQQYRGADLGSLSGTEIRALFELQQGRCAYTGTPLRIGGRAWNSASLDHKLPISQGGTNSIDNLHWVAWCINGLKGTLSDSEFQETFDAPTLSRFIIVLAKKEKHDQIPGNSAA
jgi:hypothetical protein